MPIFYEKSMYIFLSFNFLNIKDFINILLNFDVFIFYNCLFS